mmetsp:Transcript_69369/g.159147  ORF Transcript_69369/g.159147 Transcript_69369/m.159147 type:complete len:192 (+) Transcript_69369:50-625(+)
MAKMGVTFVGALFFLLAVTCHALSLSPITHPTSGVLRPQFLGDLFVPTDFLGWRLGSICQQQHKATQPPRGVPQEKLPFPLILRLRLPICCTTHRTGGGYLGCPACYAPQLAPAFATVPLYDTCDLSSIERELLGAEHAEQAAQNVPRTVALLSEGVNAFVDTPGTSTNRVFNASTYNASTFTASTVMPLI